MELGRLRLTVFLWMFMLIMILTPCYTYYMATIKQHSQPPYPHATVTSTACHYPQDIIFRFFMLGASSFLSLIFYIVFRWANQVAQRVKYPHRLPAWGFYLSQFSIMLYAITIGTIDQKDTGPLHGPSAVIFFVVWLYTIIDITIFLTDLRRWDTKVMSGWSLIIKQLLAIYVAIVWIYCLVNVLLQSQSENKQDIYVVIVQWNSVFVNILWVLSFYKEWRFFGLSLAKKETENIILEIEQ